uniref:Uncharacterized protein n=1 Tax=Tanacetum cinerariifolium TaxID=118510 RepID=A0A6L2LI82_TANCI|nr:hypothetical protein [Tanacetum cinerariifolium]
MFNESRPDCNLIEITSLVFHPYPPLQISDIKSYRCNLLICYKTLFIGPSQVYDDLGDCAHQCRCCGAAFCRGQTITQPIDRPRQPLIFTDGPTTIEHEYIFLLRRIGGSTEFITPEKHRRISANTKKERLQTSYDEQFLHG